jgi:amidase
VLDDPFCPLGSDVLEVLSIAIEALRKAGLELVQGWPKGFHPQDSFETYLRLLAAVIGAGLGEEQIRVIQQSTQSAWGHYAQGWLDGMNLTHRQWMGLTEGRLKVRAIWEEYFKTYDAFLMPENIVPAFPHDQKLTFFERKVATPQGERLYADMLKWISPATLSGCPATVAPVGRTKSNLPVGLQIMGPYLEDATPIDIAGRVTEVIGGFEPPPGF